MMRTAEFTQPAAATLSRRLLLLALIGLVFVSLLDPADQILHLKAPFFIAVMLVWSFRRGITGPTVSLTVWILTLAVGIVLPAAFTAIGILNSTVHSGDAPLALLKSFLFLLLLPMLISEDIDLLSLMMRMSLVVALVTLAMAVIHRFSPVVFLGVYEFTIAKQNAVITVSRDSFGIGLGMFYYKTSPLMIFPLAYYASRFFQPLSGRWHAFCMTLVYSAALLVSGTRANALAALFVLGTITLVRVRRTAGWQGAMALAALGIAVASATIVPKAFDKQESSNGVKLAHIRSYEEEFSAKLPVLLWGEGANSGFYSEGYQDWTTTSELTYIEMVRLFGIPVTVLLCAGLVWMGYLLGAKGAWPMALAYMAYLAISASNPLLISSTGLLAVCAVWNEAVHPVGNKSSFRLKDLDAPTGNRTRRSAAPQMASSG
jgi:hypothetical protein